MRSRTPEDLSGRCPRCYLPTRLCLCADIPRLDTRTEFLVIRHNKEKEKSTNTARMAALALTRCQVLTYGAPGAPFDASVLEAPGTWVLFPDAPPPPPDAPPPQRLVVLDGNWGQARRMMQRVPALRRLPGLSLPPPPAHTRRLRRPPHPEGMSTLEAMAGALALLEGPAQAQRLYALHERMIDRVLESRGRLGPDAPGSADLLELRGER
jgi:DTW domain-containing protein